jgi:hypothetical protein
LRHPQKKDSREINDLKNTRFNELYEGDVNEGNQQDAVNYRGRYSLIH